MKLYCFILLVTIIPIEGFSQSTSRSSFNLSDRSNLRQYLWGYSKSNLQNSEKSVIDFNDIENWRVLGNYLAVSDNGKYFSYTLNKPTGTRYWYRRLDSLIIQSTHNRWRKAFYGTNPGAFVANGNKYIFQNGESLCIMQLGKSQFRNVNGVKSYKILQHGKNEWLACQLKNGANVILHNLVTGMERQFSHVTDYNFDKLGEWLICKRANDLLIYNLVTGTEKHFSFVIDYVFANNGKALLLKTIEGTFSGGYCALKYFGVPDGQEKTIWSTAKENIRIGSYCMDNSGRQVVFSVQDSTGTGIWYYNADMDKAIAKVINTTQCIGEGLIINGDVSFTDNGRYVKFSLQSLPDTRKPDDAKPQVEVWDHKDRYLQSFQAELLKEPKQYMVLVDVHNGKLISLEGNGQKVYLLQGDFAVVKKYSNEEYGDRFWESRKRINNDSNWIASLKDGNSRVLPTRAGSSNFWFSPNGKYLVYFDSDKGCHYFSYDLQTGILKNISVNIPENHLGFADQYNGRKPELGNLAAWIENSSDVLVYDSYDIWRLDLTGAQPAINITNGFGYLNNTIFVLPTTDHYSSDIPVIKAGAPLLLRALNTTNKQSGFYRKENLNAGPPKLVYMGNYFMKSIDGYHDANLSNGGMAPVKAKECQTWIVQRQSSTDAPNYYETNDFRSYKRLTNFQPQQRFKWLSEELHSFSHLDGGKGQGILYKPDDFDSTKKYPVLVVLYGAFSNNLNQFHVPTYIDQSMEPGKSPTWFVNNGYLVFTPDIYTVPLKYGPSTFNVMEGAAQYLRQLPYVDGSKMGCASHSWSSKLGAYLFTHSQSFNATAISEGAIYANPMNIGFSTIDGKSRLWEIEVEQEWGSLYENKEAWLEFSTVLQADKAKSPLLLFSNKESGKEYQEAALQIFTALRRLEKHVWWLKYENGEHILRDLKELKDYTIRYTQFFDHYLKEAPAPLWMTQGLPIMLKGVESRYELDPKGSCGKKCTICNKWNEQYKKNPEMFNKPIQEWRFE